MLGLCVQFLLLVILILILVALFLDERRLRKIKAASGMMTGYWNGSERRTSCRIPVALKTTYSIEKKGHLKKDSISINISKGGILLELQEKLPLSALLMLSIDLADGKDGVSAEGKVVWVKGLQDLDSSGRRLFDTGIKFIFMEPKERERLDNYLAASG